jgi:hypothetical protein
MQHRTSRFAAIGVGMALAYLTFTPGVLRADDSHEYGPPHATEPYAGWLLGAYLSAPLLGIGATYALAGFRSSRVNGGDEVAGILLALLLPSSIHLYFGQLGLATRSFFLWPLAAVGGAFFGLVLGAVVGAGVRGRAEDDDLSFGEHLLIYGAVGAPIGLVLAAIVWPIFDVQDAFARDKRRSKKSNFSVGIVPCPHGGVLGVLHGTF